MSDPLFVEWEDLEIANCSDCAGTGSPPMAVGCVPILCEKCLGTGLEVA